MLEVLEHKCIGFCQRHLRVEVETNVHENHAGARYFRTHVEALAQVHERSERRGWRRELRAEKRLELLIFTDLRTQLVALRETGLELRLQYVFYKRSVLLNRGHCVVFACYTTRRAGGH